MNQSFNSAQPATIVKLLQQHATQLPNQRAYTFLADGETDAVHLTYQELDQQAQTIGYRLQQQGATGEPVLLLYPPGLEFIAALFGCFYAGAVAVPTYPPQLNRSSDRLSAIIASTQAKLYLTTTPTLTQIQRWTKQIPLLKNLSGLTTNNSQPEPVDNRIKAKVTPDTLAFLQYTSGSTALPKGVMVTHHNIMSNLDLVIQTSGFEPENHREGISWLPPYHDLGLIGFIFLGVYTGRPATLMSPVAFMQKPLRWLQAISRTQATYSAGPNFAYELCIDKITPEQRAELDLSSWEIAIVGADPVRHNTLKRFAADFASCGFHKESFYSSYGMAEATLVISGGLQSALPVTCTVQGEALKNNQVTIVSKEEPGSQTMVGCGKALVGHKVVIVDPQTRRLCLADQIGEIWASGPSVAQGYWNQPEESKRAFQAYLANGEGPFLRTGDLGFLKDGELFITGRLKDLIIIRGHNYYPQDIELVAEKSHFALRFNSGAAFSVDVDNQEQLVIVFELERRHRKANVEEVSAAIRTAVAQAYGIETYAVVLIKMGHLPKTGSGKIQRFQCRSQFLEGALPVIGSNIRRREEFPGLETPVEEIVDDTDYQQLRRRLEAGVRTHLAQFLQVSPNQIDLQQSIQSLGLGSLHATAVKFLIEEEFGVHLAPELFFEDITLEQFITRIVKIHNRVNL